MADKVRQQGEPSLSIALASGKSLRDAAALAGVNERTAARRLDDPVYRSAISSLRGQMTSEATGRIVVAMTEAADTLRELLAAKSEAVRLAAARAILELAGSLRAGTEVEERLLRLEASLGPRKRGGGNGNRTPA